MSRRLILIGLALALVSLPAGGCSSRDEEPFEADIVGTVSFLPPIDLGGIAIEIAGPESRTTAPNSTGHYEFLGLPLGDYTVTIKGHPPQADFPQGSSREASLTTNGQVVDVSFNGRLAYTGTVTGTVYVDEVAAPDLTVKLAGTTYLGGNVDRTTVTDAEGRYSFASAPGGDLYVQVDPPVNIGFDPNFVEFTIASQDTTITADFHGQTLTGRSWILGTVTVDGSGASGLTLYLDGPVSGQTKTDDQGAYAFKDLEAGSYTVTVAILPGVTFWPSARSITLGSSTARIVDFEGFTD